MSVSSPAGRAHDFDGNDGQNAEDRAETQQTGTGPAETSTNAVARRDETQSGTAKTTIGSQHIHGDDSATANGGDTPKQPSQSDDEEDL